MRRIALWGAGCVAATAILGLGALAGLWFLPLLAGVGAGLAARRRMLPVVVVVAAAGWAVPLAWLAARGQPIGGTARTIAALAGLPASAALVVAVTLLIAVVQALLGLWLVRALWPRRRGSGQTAASP
jgi:hypothetical protein